MFSKPKYASTTKEGEIPTTYGVWTEVEYQPSSRRIFLSCNSSSRAVEQFHSNASLEPEDRQELNNSKNWQWTTEGSGFKIYSTTVKLQLLSPVIIYNNKRVQIYIFNSPPHHLSLIDALKSSKNFSFSKIFATVSKISESSLYYA